MPPTAGVHILAWLIATATLASMLLLAHWAASKSGRSGLEVIMVLSAKLADFCLPRMSGGLIIGLLSVGLLIAGAVTFILPHL